jgi:hypothetical protein
MQTNDDKPATVLNRILRKLLIDIATKVRGLERLDEKHLSVDFFFKEIFQYPNAPPYLLVKAIVPVLGRDAIWDHFRPLLYEQNSLAENASEKEIQTFNVVAKFKEMLNTNVIIPQFKTAVKIVNKRMGPGAQFSFVEENTNEDKDIKRRFWYIRMPTTSVI